MRGNGNNMKTNSRKSDKPGKAGSAPHIDFSAGERGKYAARYAESTNIVVLSPDVAEVFPNSQAVNEALRTLVRLSGKTVEIPRTGSKRAGK